MVYFVCACGYWFWPQIFTSIYSHSYTCTLYFRHSYRHTAVQLKQKTGLERIKLHTNWNGSKSPDAAKLRRWAGWMENEVRYPMTTITNTSYNSRSPFRLRFRYTIEIGKILIVRQRFGISSEEEKKNIYDLTKTTTTTAFDTFHFIWFAFSHYTLASSCLILHFRNQNGNNETE